MLSRIKQSLHKAKNHQGFLRYLTNTSWMFAEQVLRMGAGLLVGIWVARYLGPAQYGLFSYATAYAALFGNIAKLGLDGVVVRDLVRDPAKRDIYMGTSFWLKLMGAVAILALMALTLQLTSNDPTTRLYIFIIASGVLFQSFEVVDFYFQSQVLLRFVSICKLIQLTISSLLKLYFVFTNGDLIWFVLISLVDQMTLALSLFVAYRMQGASSFYRYFDIKVAKHLLQNSWPLMLAGLAVTLYMRVDMVMLQEMTGEVEVGIYAAATRISEIWYFLPSIIVASVSPAITQAHSLNAHLYLMRLRQLYSLMAWLAIGIALPLSIFSNAIIQILFGVKFAEAAPVLAIHLWASLAVFLGIASSQYLLIEQLQRISLYRTLIGLICNIVLNLILIPDMGARGAAIATVISYFIATFSLFFFKSTRAHTMHLLAAPFRINL